MRTGNVRIDDAVLQRGIPGRKMQERRRDRASAVALVRERQRAFTWFHAGKHLVETRGITFIRERIRRDDGDPGSGEESACRPGPARPLSTRSLHQQHEVERQREDREALEGEVGAEEDARDEQKNRDAQRKGNPDGQTTVEPRARGIGSRNSASPKSVACTGSDTEQAGKNPAIGPSPSLASSMPPAFA